MPGERVLSHRVSSLIHHSHGGDVNAAAKWLQLPQPTLYKIAVGKTRNPRVGTLLVIAEAYSVSVDWLIYGPRPPAARRLESLIAKLRLPKRERRAIEALVASSEYAARSITGVDAGPFGPPTPLPAVHGEFAEAIARAWFDLLAAALRAHGREQLRAALAHYAVHWATGGSPLARTLLDDQHLRMEIEKLLNPGQLLRKPSPHPFHVRLGKLSELRKPQAISHGPAKRD